MSQDEISNLVGKKLFREMSFEIHSRARRICHVRLFKVNIKIFMVMLYSSGTKPHRKPCNENSKETQQINFPND